jgi:hypothetical protein
MCDMRDAHQFSECSTPARLCDLTELVGGLAELRGPVPVSFASAERSTPASRCELSELAVSAARLADGRGTAPLPFASAERSTPASAKGTASLRPADGRGTAPLPFASPNLARARGFRQRGTFHTGRWEGHRTPPIRQRGTFHTGRCLLLAFSGDGRLLNIECNCQCR